MSTARPPLTRGTTSPGALYYRNDRDWERSDGHAALPQQAGGSGMSSYFPHVSPSRSPTPTSPQVPVVTVRGSRSPTEGRRVQPDVQVSPSAYSLIAQLGNGFHPECITISAKKGNALVIVADQWDAEQDCRHEWVWQFDRDADMSSVHANFNSGVLRVTVKRIPGYRLGNN